MVLRSKKRDFVRDGWFSLHESVLLVGTEIDIGSYLGGYDTCSTRWLDTGSYASLIRPIIKVTHVAIQSPSDNTDKVANEIWGCIRRLKKQLTLPSNAFHRTSLHGFVAAYNAWSNNQTDINTQAISQSTPLDAATTGWKLIQHAARHNDRIETLFWGLGILGWVSAIYSGMRICRYCFRWSVPGSPFCFVHTQSTSTTESKGKAYVRYRKGARILTLAQQRGIDIRRSNAIIDSAFWRALLAEYLFFNLPSETDGIELRQILDMSPHVLRLLGGMRILSIPDKQLFRLVRNKINPMEMFPPALTHNVMLAEKILSLEEESKLGRPRGKQTKRVLKMTDKAKSLFKDGASQSEVAVILKVSRAAVSNWIRRYDDVRYAYLSLPIANS